MKKLARTCLTDLPMALPQRDLAAVSDVILDTFVQERKACQNSHQLRNFVKKWRAMWLLAPGSRMPNAQANSVIQKARLPPTLEEKLLLTGSYDGKYVLRVLASEDGAGIDYNCKNARIAGCLAIPSPALHASMLASAYGVCSDLGFVRLYMDTYPGLDDFGR